MGVRAHAVSPGSREGASAIVTFEVRETEIPTVPFRGIDPFRYVDHSIFFARGEETHYLASLVSVYRGVMLYGGSGSGKSSLINAGLVPEAIRLGFAPERLRMQPRDSEELVIERILATDEGADLPSVLTEEKHEKAESRGVLSIEAFRKRVLAACERHRPLLIFDQFEEIVTLFDEADAREAQRSLLHLVVDMLRGELPVKILLSFREDYLGKVKELLSECPELVDHALRLAPPSAQTLPIIIRGPFECYPGHFEREISSALAEQLVTVLAERFGAGEISLSEVQTVCLRLWQSQNPAALLAEKGPQGLLEDYLGEALAGLPGQLRPAAIALLSQMVTAAGTRNVISAADLVQRVRDEEGELSLLLLEDALERLSQSRLVHRERRRELYLYEISSEFLVPWISRRRAEFRQLQERHRERRRLLIVGAIAGGLLLVVILVSALAIWGLDQRQIAVSGELSLQAEALSPDQVDRSLLLSLDAIATHRSERSLGALLSALNTNTSIEREMHFPNPIRGMALKPGSDTLAVGDTSGAVRLVDSSTGRAAGPVIQVQGEVRGIAFSPDGTIMAISAYEAMSAEGIGRLRQFDARTGRPVDTPPSGHARTVSIRSVRYSPDGRWLATGGSDGKIFLIDRQSNHHLLLGRHKDWVNSLVFTQDGRYLFSGGGVSEHKYRDIPNHNLILLWDLRTRRLVREFHGAKDAIRSIALSPDGRDIAAACGDGYVRVWNRETARLRWHKRAGKDRVYSVRYAKDGKYLASAGRDGLIRFWDPDSMDYWRRSPIDAHEGAAAGLAMLPNNLLASAGEDGRLVIVRPERSAHNRLGTHVGRSEDAQAVAVDPATGMTAVGYNNGTVVLRNSDGTVHPKWLDTEDRQGIAGLAFAPGQRLVTASNTGRLEVWSTSTSTSLAGPVSVGDDLDAVAVSPDRSVLATGGASGDIRLWTMQLEPIGPPLPGHVGEISALAFASNTTLISAGWDRAVMQWTGIGPDAVRSIPRGHSLAPPGQGAAFTSVTTSPDGRTVAAGDVDGELVFFAMTDRNAKPTVSSRRNGTAEVTFVGYTSDRRMMVSADSAGEVRLWLVTPQPRLVGLVGQVGRIDQAALTPDGRTLRTAGEDGETVWDLDTSSWVRRACTIAGRNLSSEERTLFERKGTRHFVCAGLPVPTASLVSPSAGR